MRGPTVRGSSCPSDRKHARSRGRQEAIELSRSECLGQAVADESRSAPDGYVREGGADPVALPEGRLDGGLRRGLAVALGHGCQGFEPQRHRAAQGEVGAGVEKYGPKYEAACNCLSKDRDVLLAFYDFPAEHWGHLRTTNPSESTVSTIRLRHRRTKGSGARKASLTMMFKLAQSASRRWRRLNAHHQIVLVLEGRIFTDGVLQNAA